MHLINHASAETLNIGRISYLSPEIVVFCFQFDELRFMFCMFC